LSAAAWRLASWAPLLASCFFGFTLFFLLLGGATIDDKEADKPWPVKGTYITFPETLNLEGINDRSVETAFDTLLNHTMRPAKALLAGLASLVFSAVFGMLLGVGRYFAPAVSPKEEARRGKLRSLAMRWWGNALFTSLYGAVAALITAVLLSLCVHQITGGQGPFILWQWESKYTVFMVFGALVAAGTAFCGLGEPILYRCVLKCVLIGITTGLLIGVIGGFLDHSHEGLYVGVIYRPLMAAAITSTLGFSLARF
jgi:hypothetical protein